jgi:DNA-binding XRE family transcriptional regulator
MGRSLEAGRNADHGPGRRRAERASPEARRRLAEELIDLRRARGMTQRELAASAGLQQADISRLEAGRSNPTFDTLAAIARALRTEIALVASRGAGGRPRGRGFAGEEGGRAPAVEHTRKRPGRSEPRAAGRRVKFLCLICAAKLMEQMTLAEAESHRAGYRALTARLWKRGQLVSCNRLLPPEAATTVRVRNGEVSVVDGPFAETKELVGGYFVIEARDRAEAVRIASRIPGASIGCVEVRPIADDAATLHALGLSADAAG